MLRPAIKFTIGDKLYDQQVVTFRLRRTQLPALDRLEVLLPVAAKFDASPGDDCNLKLDGGDDGATVFTGTLSAVRSDFSGLHLVAHNGGLRLARYRPAASFERMSVGDIIAGYCADAGVAMGNCVKGPALSLYVADGRSTAAEEIARLAGYAGALGAFNGAGELYVTGEGGPAGEMALRYGRELLGAESTRGLTPNIAVTAVGEGAGPPASTRGRWVISDFFTGNAPTPGVGRRLVARPELRTTEDARTASAALAQRQAMSWWPVKLRLWLNPKIEPGMRLQLSDMPGSLPLEECRVSQVISSAIPGGAMTTEVWASGFMENASELPGAIGGLL